MPARVSKSLAASLARTSAAPKRSKFNAKRTQVGDLWFDSKKEAARYCQLRILLNAGLIDQLERQVEYTLTANGVVIGKIIPDFRYLRTKTGERVVEEVKSKPTKTQLFRWKAKHLLAEHGVTLEIV